MSPLCRWRATITRVLLRQHARLPDGSLRDTCVYSIIASEWPMVRRGLTAKLDQGSRA